MTDGFGKVAVLMGGISAERDVSLKSGCAVLEGLREVGVDAHAIDAGHDVIARLLEGGFNKAFIALHGRWGEDGVIQGALEVIGMPYTGSGVMASALAMDKIRSKYLWMGMGISTPPFIETDGDINMDEIVKMGFPLFIKPAREGSSVGMTKVLSAQQLRKAMEHAGKHDSHILIEKYIDGRELTVAVLNDRALPVICVETPHDFYDYEAKYEVDTTLYHCPCGLDEDTETYIQNLALQAYHAIGCSGWGRVDIMMDKSGNAYVLEVNTVPGMTDHSLVPMAAKQAGMNFSQLVTAILETGNGA